MSDGSTAKVAEYPAGEVVGRREQEPCAWMSTCSEAGIAWVCEAIGSRAFAKIAERFKRSMHHRLSTSTDLMLTSRGIEPTETIAWEYVNAFFDNCWEARIGLIHRSDFEAQLQAHFHNETYSRNDYPMIALRNVVFAAGYRSILANTPSVSFSTAQTKPWQCYFKNALSVLTKLLLSPPKLMTVQALALMACYVEGLGSPGFQRVLCYNAVHAAVTQGLHRESDYLTETSSDDSLKKAWLWWALYAQEKHISLTSGRASMIDDHIRSTRVPSRVPVDSNMDLECLSLQIRHAEISSRISREIMSTKATRSSTDELLRTVKDLGQQLKDLVDEIPPGLQIGTLAKPSEEAHLISRRIQALQLHFSIYGSLLAVHCQFFFPWITSRFLNEGAETSFLEPQIALSSSTVAEAARKILLAVRTVTTNVTTPTWLAFFYPIYAHMSLFIYILKYPTLSTVSSDLGLLDVCAGHFGHIEFITSSEISVSLPRDSVNLAAKVVKAAKKRERQASGSKPEHPQCMGSLETQDQALGDHNPSCPRFHGISPTFGHTENFTGIETGGWNLFPFFDTISGNDFNFDHFEA
ncbi:uncharacterized protein A1O5_08550 [Cladophialophora psammophila CBS 110553]|uniref:Xylanolytic transcriptional activator regulatory domain-containing protein n=1 Tax=Cladophialophora psammophila CBS 110553 TaxID=1182543 RepID=W9WTH7_9EURO|nr:uncharacterized protein A1O5_08550 [Cladophialophora psammophila CBS 110553]EXJ67936.1 hypothetical protein A1O5_08550 [Cladophialophora psammophila CBS 110553]